MPLWPLLQCGFGASSDRPAVCSTVMDVGSSLNAALRELWTTNTSAISITSMPDQGKIHDRSVSLFGAVIVKWCSVGLGSALCLAVAQCCCILASPICLGSGQLAALFSQIYATRSPDPDQLQASVCVCHCDLY